MNIQIKDIFGKILFEYDGENNTIRETVAKADEEGLNLNYVDLVNADLSGINLSYADLSHANLCGATLYGARLRFADLSNANLNSADLRNTNLENASIHHANLYNANLCSANLGSADLSYTTLCGADLRNAFLKNANLIHADLFDAKNIPYIPLACPSEGSFIAWKKVSNYKEDYKGEFLVKLLIPEDAKRISATTSKCRCDKARVLEITSINNGSTVNEITNANYSQCIYKVGEFVYSDSFDENRWIECTNGIHFFIDKQEAINH